MRNNSLKGVTQSLFRAFGVERRLMKIV